jgi:methionyl aminopeptidase
MLNDNDFLVLKEVCDFTKELREKSKRKVKEGASVEEICNFIEGEIFKNENGYLPAFPCGVAINNVAAHYTHFDKEIILKKGDVVSIDFGVSKNGIISDNAYTVEIETKIHEKLIHTNEKALNRVCENVKIGMRMEEIGKIVEDTGKEEGFETIHNLSGHQVDINDLHCGLSVPNFENQDKDEVFDGCQLAIEPFLTLGKPLIKQGENSNILQLISTKPIRSPMAQKILKHIQKNFPHLPFSKRWLIKDIAEELGLKIGGFEKTRVQIYINELKRNGNIKEYEILESVSGDIVSQFEHTFYFKKGKTHILTKSIP